MAASKWIVLWIQNYGTYVRLWELFFCANYVIFINYGVLTTGYEALIKINKGAYHVPARYLITNKARIWPNMYRYLTYCADPVSPER